MVMYFLIGILFGGVELALFLRFKSAERSKFIGAFVLTLIGNLFIALAMAWGYASYLEHEMQAIAMGFLVFGGFGIIVDIIAIRVFVGKSKAKKVAAPSEGAPKTA